MAVIIIWNREVVKRKDCCQWPVGKNGGMGGEKKPSFEEKTRFQRYSMNLLRKHIDPDYILGNIPLANKLETPHERYELGFRWMPEGCLRLTTFVDPALMFSNYAYRSSTLSVEHVSSRMTYARRIYDRLNKFRKPKSVCEVACNDGYMLNRYAGNDDRFTAIVGVEPAENLHRYIDDKVCAYARLMNERIGASIWNLHGAFDIIHAHNVAAHTPNPVDLLNGIGAMMDAHSVAVVEFQYLVDLLTNTQFYHFYHEHYYYYTVAGFANVAEKAGLEMVTAKRVEAQGGSILCALVRIGDWDDDELKAVASDQSPVGNNDRCSVQLKTGQDIRCDTDSDPHRIAHFEKNYFSRGDIFANFMKRTERKLKNFVQYVNAQPRGTLQGLFASAEATVILNLAMARGLRLDRFACFYDDTVEKWGRCVPGTEIPIRAMHPIEKANGRAILFAPNLADLVRHLLPDVEIINVEDVFGREGLKSNGQ